ncbi:integral membrane protein [Nannizzia gypsea CBS 118893]|uniref:Integral membrane protein n=1 Tax=Arthroderma gypseum (strain ATCC MYA-4604 / CBS 118893) TaxID=535722 RepID=E4UR26_ARTGP|nr:integral membrane protein [Nannizzia gypsea CBS 118893]EFR00141.1 integral membrane protein [Nannizzia gypsea CBS 118893]
MQLPPVSVIASWPTPNYDNPTEVHGSAIIIMTAIFMPLMLAVIGIRIFTRIRILRSFGWDDIFIIAAALPTLGCGIITTTAAITLGWNRHIYDVPIWQLILGLRLTMLLECLFATGCTLTKLSLLFFTRKIMKGSGSPALQWTVVINIWIVAIELVIFILVVVFTCRPVSLYWKLSILPQNCINESAHLLASGAINTATDIIVIVLPIPSVLSLSLPVRQRIVLILLFGAGFGVCIAGGVRAYYTYRLNIAHDKTWEAYYLWISGTVELYVGVIGASVASLRPFLARYIPSIFGNQRERASYAFASTVARRYGFRRSNRGKPKPRKVKEVSEATTITMNCDFDFDLGYLRTQKSEMGPVTTASRDGAAEESNIGIPPAETGAGSAEQ